MSFHAMSRSGVPPSPQDIAPSGWSRGRADALRRDAARDLGLASLAVLAASIGLAVFGGFGGDYVGKAAVLWALGVWLVWRGLAPGGATDPAHPHARFGPANRVTLLRMGGLALVAALLGEAVPSAPPAALPAAAWALVVLTTVVAVLDAADGALARRSGLASRFGARFDMETDAAFTLVLCALVLQAAQAGPWVLASGLMRYAFVAAALALPWLNGPLPPSKRRQTVCVIQITALIICLGPIVPPWLASALAAGSLALLTWSFAIDVVHLAKTRHTFREIAP